MMYMPNSLFINKCLPDFNRVQLDNGNAFLAYAVKTKRFNLVFYIRLTLFIARILSTDLANVFISFEGIGLISPKLDAFSPNSHGHTDTKFTCYDSNLLLSPHSIRLREMLGFSRSIKAFRVWHAVNVPSPAASHTFQGP